MTQGTDANRDEPREELLVLEGLTKAYPGVVANSDVSFRIGKGEVHALLGENGAGKSTLVKMIYGLVRPDSGRMQLRGQPYHPAKPAEARRLGVAMVFQHFSLFEALNVAENVALGMENPPPMRELAGKIRSVSEAYGLPFDPARMVGDLSAGERQRVEIIRCLLQDPKLLIMDEPTSVLTPQEVEILFHTLRKLAAEGTSILYISHKLEEIRALCDTATILRRGRVVATCTPRDRSARDLAELMVGTALEMPARSPGEKGAEALGVTSLSLPSPIPFGTSLKNIAFSVAKGEVLGIAGVAGNGQDELLLALSGELRAGPAQLRLNGQPIGNAQIPHYRCHISYLSQRPALLDGTVEDNLRFPFSLKTSRKRRFDLATVTTLLGHAGKTPDFLAKRAADLSGGESQVVSLIRTLQLNPEVLLLDEPTAALDPTSSREVEALIDPWFAVDRSRACVWVSHDLEQARRMSDIHLQMSAGVLSGVAQP